MYTKKRNIFSAVLISVMLAALTLTATSCSMGEENSTLEDHMKQVIETGKLKSLGVNIKGEGTHILEKKDGTTIRLKSINVNLDSTKYINKNVEVRGELTSASDGKDLLFVTSIDLAEQSKEDKDNPGEEQELKSTDLGIKFLYIDNWKLEEESTSITLTSSNKDTIVISRLSNPDKKTIEGFLGLPTDTNELIIQGYTELQIGPNEMTGLKKENSDSTSIISYLQRDNFVYKLSFSNKDEDNLTDNKNLYFSLLNSFTFIPFDGKEDEMEDTTIGNDEENDTANNLIDEEEVNEKPIDEPEEVADEPVEPEVVDPEPEEVSQADYNAVTGYINSNINSIAPKESSSGSSWNVTKYEFAGDNYVYVEYNDKDEYRKALFSYTTNGGVSTEVVGYFEPGETASWDRVSGENPAAYSEKTVVTVSDSGSVEETIVKEGYRYFESLPYHFKAQYPANWYYSGQSGGEDSALHHYGFSNEPIEDSNELVSLDIVSSAASGGSSVSVGGHQGTKVISGDTVAIYILRDDGKYYKIHGSVGNESYVMEIAASIEE